MLKGIDISHWNGNIDWDKFMLSSHKDFVFIKSSQDLTGADRDYRKNSREAYNRGILRGAYHYVTETSLKYPYKSVCNFVENYADVPFANEVIPVLDIEDGTLTKYTIQALDSFIYEMVTTFLEITGVYPVIYISEKWMPGCCNSVKNLCAGWIAAWRTTGNKPYRNDLNTTFWQYSSAGSVAGFKGKVDLNKGYLTEEAWYRIANPGS